MRSENRFKSLIPGRGKLQRVFITAHYEAENQAALLSRSIKPVYFGEWRRLIFRAARSLFPRMISATSKSQTHMFRNTLSWLDVLIWASFTSRPLLTFLTLKEFQSISCPVSRGKQRGGVDPTWLLSQTWLEYKDLQFKTVQGQNPVFFTLYAG